jgi:uncharacterized cupredoxin-like copper-binding protein
MARSATRRGTRGWLIAALAAAVAVLLGSVLVASAWAGAFGSGAAATWGFGAGGSGLSFGQSRGVPALAGTVVNVSLVNMGGPLMGQRTMMGGAMRLGADRASVSAGTVSFAVTNYGSIDHELVILPLADNQQVGARPLGSDGKIDEAGSLGEASNTGGQGAGQGIRAGSSGWVTLTLAPGHYELVCNLPGHYAAGMYAELTVS